MERFFDNFPEFFNSSVSGVSNNRLNGKYKALINENLECIKGKRILDLTSHDGRWTFAALKNGAEFVTGIEGRKELIDNAYMNLSTYGIPKTKYKFIEGDVFEQLKQIKPGEIDTVFCFGFFYHIANHMLLLNEIKRINPKYLLLETTISTSEESIVEIMLESSEYEFNAIEEFEDYRHVLVGWPSRKAIEAMLESIGFTYRFTNWRNLGITDWNTIEDFKEGSRMSLKAINLDRTEKLNGQYKLREVTERLSELVNRGEFNEALSIATEILEIIPFDAGANYYKAYCLHVIGSDLEQAIEYYNRALINNFDEFWVFYNRGDALIKLERFADALQDLQSAEMINPYHKGVKHLLSLIVRP
jgi:tetratricopeptide (TPR) repeat protein